MDKEEWDNKRVVQFLPQLNGLSRKSGLKSCDPETAAIQAGRLFGFYRASEANDAEVFVTGAARMLAEYPEAVVLRVCDPVRGLPATNKWLPSIAEIREACEGSSDPMLSEPRPGPKGIDYVAEPWLQHAKVEILADGRRRISGPEVDRAWRIHQREIALS